MRIAIIADIHGNLRALEAVQKDLRAQSPDLIVNLGDHLSGPLQAAATADAIMAESWANIRGNHDRHLIDRPPEAMGLSDRAAHDQIDDRHRVWLQKLPASYDLEGEILLCHGSPASDEEYLLENTTPEGMHQASVDSILARLGDVRPPVLLCGHSHLPRAIHADRTFIVNPGSIGLQAYDDPAANSFMEVGSPHARYALLDRTGPGWRLSFIAVEYDWHAASKEAAFAGRPDWAHALATGCALRA